MDQVVHPMLLSDNDEWRGRHYLELHARQRLTVLTVPFVVFTATEDPHYVALSLKTPHRLSTLVLEPL
jgi:hypothetical protein